MPDGDPNDQHIDTRPFDGIPSRREKLQVMTDVVMAAAAGLMDTTDYMRKFGYNLSIGAAFEDIWVAGGDYDFFPATAQTMEVVSASAQDTNGGNGAHSIRVIGLDGDFNPLTEDVVLNGGTVVMQNQFIRMWRAYVLVSGANEANVDDITVQISPGGTVAALIEADRAQTLQTNFTVRAGYRFALRDVSFSLPTGRSQEVVIITRDFGSNTWRTRWIGYCYQNVVPIDQHFALVLEEKADLRVRARADAPGTPIACWWNAVEWDVT